MRWLSQPLLHLQQISGLAALLSRAVNCLLRSKLNQPILQRSFLSPLRSLWASQANLRENRVLSAGILSQSHLRLSISATAPAILLCPLNLQVAGHPVPGLPSDSHPLVGNRWCDDTWSVVTCHFWHDYRDHLLLKFDPLYIIPVLAQNLLSVSVYPRSDLSSDFHPKLEIDRPSNLPKSPTSDLPSQGEESWNEEISLPVSCETF